MPISINGSGLVTGVNTSNFFTSNSITTNLLANNAVTVDKLGTTSRVVKFTQLTYNTRVAWGTATDAVIWSPFYTKERSDSSLFVQMSLSTYGTNSYSYNWFARYAGSSYVLGTMGNVASSLGYNMRQSCEFLLSGITNTGSNTFDIRWTTKDVQAGNKPANVWNPNNSDESRLEQQFSSLNVWEYI